MMKQNGKMKMILARTLSDALRAKAQKGVVAIAGGTDLLVRLGDQPRRNWPRLLFLDHIAALHGVRERKDHLAIGPLVTFSELESSRLIRRWAPQLAMATAIAGSVQIRNRATIGGNLANASPAGDCIPPLYVLGATLVLSSIRGQRLLPIEDFFVGPKATVLRPGELITEIRLPKKRTLGFFLRLGARQALAISKVSVAVALRLRKDRVESCRIALGAVAPTVIRAVRAENLLLGKSLNPALIIEAAQTAANECAPIDDIRSLATYRRAMVSVLLQQGLTELLAKARK